MNISELEAIAAVELYGSFVGAAKRTGMPLSTLSKRISRAEEELGVTLIERKTAAASVLLTEQGTLLMPLIHKLIAVNSSMIKTAQNMLGKNESTLVLGKPALLGDIGDSTLIAGFLAENADAELVCVVRSRDELLRLLMDGHLECAFFLMTGGSNSKSRIWDIFQVEQYNIYVLRESQDMYIGISEDSPLADKDTVNITQLRDYTFIFTKWHDVFASRYGERPLFFEFLSESRRDYKIIYEDFINSDYIYRLVIEDKYVVPQVFPDKYPKPGIKFLKLEDWKRHTAATFVARKYGSRALKRFTDYVMSNAREIQPGEAIFGRTE